MCRASRSDSIYPLPLGIYSTSLSDESLCVRASKYSMRIVLFHRCGSPARGRTDPSSLFMPHNMDINIGRVRPLRLYRNILQIVERLPPRNVEMPALLRISSGDREKMKQVQMRDERDILESKSLVRPARESVLLYSAVWLEFICQHRWLAPKSSSSRILE